MDTNHACNRFQAVVENLKALYKERLTGFEDYLNKGKQLPVPSGRLLRGDAAGAAGLARPPPAFRPSDRAGPSNEAAPDKAATRSKVAHFHLIAPPWTLLCLQHYMTVCRSYEGV